MSTAPCKCYPICQLKTDRAVAAADVSIVKQAEGNFDLMVKTALGEVEKATHTTHSLMVSSIVCVLRIYISFVLCSAVW